MRTIKTVLGIILVVGCLVLAARSPGPGARDTQRLESSPPDFLQAVVPGGAPETPAGTPLSDAAEVARPAGNVGRFGRGIRRQSATNSPFMGASAGEQENSPYARLERVVGWRHRHGRE